MTIKISEVNPAMIASFQRGEEKGFTFFYNLLCRYLLYYSFRITQDKAASEDIVEQSFMKIWNREDKSRFTHPNVIKSFLFTTVKNDSINYHINLKRATTAYAALAIENKDAVELPIIQHMMQAEIINELYTRASIILPPRCKEVFNLLFIQGKTLQEVVKATGNSISTVKNQRARAIELIRKSFPDIGDSLALL